MHQSDVMFAVNKYLSLNLSSSMMQKKKFTLCARGRKCERKGQKLNFHTKLWPSSRQNGGAACCQVEKILRGGDIEQDGNS